jgi:hypothetical protein
MGEALRRYIPRGLHDKTLHQTLESMPTILTRIATGNYVHGVLGSQ